MGVNGIGWSKPLPTRLSRAPKRLSTVKLKNELPKGEIAESRDSAANGMHAPAAIRVLHNARTPPEGRSTRTVALGMMGKECQPAFKPGSVRRDAKPRVTAIHLGRPLPDASRNLPGRLAWNRRGPFSPHAAPIRFCSRWGLPCRFRYRSRGGLLPHPFTLTGASAPAVCFLWHFPWGRPRRALPGTFALWCPDFPHRPIAGPAQPSGELTRITCLKRLA